MASIDALFREQVQRTPHQAAVVHGDVSLDYGELDRRVEALSAAMNAHGVTAEARVVLCAVRSVEMVVGMLACLRVGAAYVPVDPALPERRLRSVLEQTSPSLLLVSAAATQRFGAHGLPICELDAVLPSAGVTQSTAAVGELAYVIFTSGTTGVPKGVQVRQRGLVNHALSMIELYALRAGDRVLCSASIAFDVIAEQVYPALLAGATVVIRPEQLFESLQTFDAFLHQQCISTVILPTAFFHTWAHAVERDELSVPASLRAVGVGTEQVRARELHAFLERAPASLRFLHGYGPTEATVTCTVYVQEGKPLTERDPIPIGRPLPNIETYVVRSDGSLAHDEEVGELYVGGVGVAHGYLGNAALNEARFVRPPFAKAQGTPLFRTGDLVSRRRDGLLLFHGREDEQIKVRGHRIEPREIELTLLEHPRVSDALVMLRRDDPDAPQLVAYLETSDALDPRELARLCQQSLASYMVPSAFVCVPAFPKTLNQKVDRAALPPPTAARAGYEPPRNDVELMVARAFEHVLERVRVGIHDDFFMLGGDSLRALLMLQAIRRNASCQLALADVFASPTVAALAERVAVAGGVDAPAVLCLKQGVGTPIFLVCGIHIYQAFADAMRADNPIYALLLPSEEDIAGGQVACVEQLAADYLRVLREHTPRGPYVLGGLSFGGAVAYEMAQQLTRSGERVPCLFLIDTVLPRAKRWLTRDGLQTAWRSLGSSQRVRSVVVGLAQRALRAARRTAPAREADTRQELRKFDQRRERSYEKSFIAYDRTIRPYGGRVVLYRATASGEGAHTPHYGFGRLASNLEIWDVVGDHLGVLRAPGVEEMVQHLARVLAAGDPLAPQARMPATHTARPSNEGA